MPPYIYPLPTTSLLTFSNVFIDPTSSHTTVLADATSARTRLHLALKATAGNEPGSSALAVIEAILSYLPYLRGIINAVDADKLLFKTDPVFYWRSPLTHYSIASPPLLPLHSLHSEHLFVLLSYTLALSNHAASILASLPQMHGAHLTTEEEKRTTAGLARAVDLLCQAAGVADWAAENVVVLLDPIRAASGGRVSKYRWPIECGAEAMRGLSMTLLADAHITAIRKLLLPVLSHTLFAPPGPPLPSNHPSPSLLAKLYLHITSLYTSSRALFKVNSDTPKKLFKSDKDEPDSVEGEVIPPFKRYLAKESMLSVALARKWLGVDAGENGKGAKVGEAIAWMKDAQSRLEDMEDSAIREKMKGLGIGKGNEKRKEERKARQGRVERDIEDVAAWLKSYERENKSVAFQTIPPVASLTTPAGRPIFAAKVFVPPPSKFGSVEEDDETAPGPTSGEDNTYAGKGNYF